MFDEGRVLDLNRSGCPLVALASKHSDCIFMPFTNGTLIDDDFAQELLRVGNIVPAISVEGFQEATDFRRGQGLCA